MLVRETHVSDPLPPQGLQIQVSFAYSDGFGRDLQSKIQAEPGDAPIRAANVLLPSGDVCPGSLTLNNGVPVLGSANPRWVGKGRTVYNNKGKPFKQYEPFFSSTQLYESEPEMTDTGVTPILFYDPVERVVATLHPNHTFEKVVFDPWRQETWDVNDTVTLSDPKIDPDVGAFFQLLPAADFLPTWYDQRRNGQKGLDEKAAADKAAAHAATPTVAYFDTLGRPMLTVADNGKDANGAAQKFATRVTLDIEGNQREVKDANNRVVMRYDYDMLGNRIHQSSMEAGRRWMLNDVTGKPIRAWDSRDHSLRTEFDELRRPLRSFVIGADQQNPAREIRFEETVYGESASTGLTAAQVLQANLRGKPYKHYDTAGVVTSEAHDFKGNLLRSTRQLVQDYKTTPDWSQNPQPVLETEIFDSSTRYDALNRPIQMVAPHSNQANSQINVIRPGYNEANLLERVDAWPGQTAEPSVLLDPPLANLHAVTNIDYDAKGQRTRIAYGNGALTEYTYDEQTFHLIHLKTNRAGMVFQDLFYTYDPAGNITHIRDDAQQTTYFNGQVVRPDCDYLYDAIYRLINATGREHIGQLAQPQTTWNDEFRVNLPQPGDGQAMRNYTEQYLYDAVGNFEKLIHQAANGTWTRAYAYTEVSLIETAKQSNRLSSTTVGATTEPYTYDAHGNMTGMLHLMLMQWDFKDQLSATSRQAVNATPPPDKVPETTFYVYDASGQRVRKVTERQNGSRKAERIYLGGFEIYREFKGNGIDIALERETLHIMDDKQRIALVETRTQGNDGSPPQLIRYQFGNHLGSASLELDDKGSVISYEEYTPYDSTSYQAVDRNIKAAAKRYRYTGKERDEETGFTYHGARYYAPWLGRWISCDPIGLEGSINLFAFCDASPLIKTDNNGMFPAVIVVVVTAVVIIVSIEHPANGPSTPEVEKGKVEPRPPLHEDLARAVVVAGSGGPGGAVGKTILSKLGGSALAKVAGPTAVKVASATAGGFVSGATNAVGQQGIDDVKKGQVSSAGTYVKRAGTEGAGVALLAGGGTAAGLAVQKAAGLVKPAGVAPRTPKIATAPEPAAVTEPAAPTTPAGEPLLPNLTDAEIADPTALRPIGGYKDHGLNQAIDRNGGRGVDARAISDAQINPKKGVLQAGRPPFPDNTIKLQGTKANVVINEQGKVITVTGKARGPQQRFDPSARRDRPEWSGSAQRKANALGFSYSKKHIR